jgi:hypothetical protein
MYPATDDPVTRSGIPLRDSPTRFVAFLARLFCLPWASGLGLCWAFSLHRRRTAPARGARLARHQDVLLGARRPNLLPVVPSRRVDREVRVFHPVALSRCGRPDACPQSLASHSREHPCPSHPVGLVSGSTRDSLPPIRSAPVPCPIKT